MADLIDRQAAIDALAAHERSKGHNYIMFIDVVSECAEIIRDLPSAQPEQKVGKWIIKYDSSSGWYRVTCSECGEDVTSEIRLIGFIPNYKALWDYCPYCGSHNGGGTG